MGSDEPPPPKGPKNFYVHIISPFVKLVKTNLRSTMGQDRLSSLMLMKVYRQLAAVLPLTDLVDKFERHPRRMLLNCMLKD